MNYYNLLILLNLAKIWVEFALNNEYGIVNYDAGKNNEYTGLDMDKTALPASKYDDCCRNLLQLEIIWH